MHGDEVLTSSRVRFLPRGLSVPPLVMSEASQHRPRASSTLRPQDFARQSHSGSRAPTCSSALTHTFAPQTSSRLVMLTSPRYGRTQLPRGLIRQRWNTLSLHADTSNSCLSTRTRPTLAAPRVHVRPALVSPCGPARLQTARTLLGAERASWWPS